MFSWFRSRPTKVTYQCPQCSHQAPPKLAEEVGLKLKKIELKVNANCDGCREKVNKALIGIKGVVKVEIDPNSNRKVTVYGDVNPDDLIKKLRKVNKRAEVSSIVEAPKDDQKKKAAAAAAAAPAPAPVSEEKKEPAHGGEQKTKDSSANMTQNNAEQNPPNTSNMNQQYPYPPPNTSYMNQQYPYPPPNTSNMNQQYPYPPQYYYNSQPSCFAMPSSSSYDQANFVQPPPIYSPSPVDYFSHENPNICHIM